MTKAKKKFGDPRKAGGRVAGPGGAWERNGVVIDATDAVLLDDVHVAMVEPFTDGKPALPAVLLKLSGRINKTDERAEIAYLFDADGAAAIITELAALGSRQGGAFAADLKARLDARMDALTDEGAL